jgi:DNA-binding Xre family transcriptional regulator
MLGKKTRRKPTTSVRKPVNKTNLEIAQLLMRKQDLRRKINITNAAIRVLKSRK